MRLDAGLDDEVFDDEDLLEGSRYNREAMATCSRRIV